MASLQDIMRDCGLAPTELTKEASATSTASVSEVDEVLENLGINKTASEEAAPNGGPMNLDHFYQQVMGTKDAPAVVAAPAVVEETKVASAPVEAEGPTSDFGTTTGSYLQATMGAFLEKVAASLEAEAGKGHQPQAGVDASGSMSAVIGKPGDPAMAVNHDASSGADLKVTTQGHSPYSLAVVQQQILKRIKGVGVVGEQK